MKYSTRRTLRTMFQTLVAFAVALPVIVDASGIPATLPWVAGALAVAGTVTRVMAVPGIQHVLPGWLRTDEQRPAVQNEDKKADKAENTEKAAVGADR